MNDELPEARLRGSAWARLVTGPAFAIGGPFRWAATQAIAACIVQATLFAIASGIGPFILFAVVIIGSIQWTITSVAMFGVAQLAPLLHRQRRRASARVVGAIVTALVAWTIEMVAAGTYVTWFDGAWRDSFYFVALGTGALWGLWLPGVGASSIPVE